MADYPLMKYWQAPDGTVYEVCDKEARRLAEEGGGSGGGIDEAQLTEAVNAALEQAKASGEFDGADGKDGKDGVSVTHRWDGTKLIVTSASGTTSADLKGNPGDDGDPGKDGVSPTISISVITGGHRLTIKDANGTKTVDLLDGSDGSPGATGETGATGVGIKNIVFKQNTTAGNVYTINLTDGSSYDFTAPAGPKGADGSGGTGGGGSGEDGVGIQSIQLKSEADTGNTYTIILTDGSTYDFTAPAGPSGKDGSNGEPGKDGTSVTVASVTESAEDGGSNVVKFSDGKTVTIKNGSKGSGGADGKDGTSVTVTNVSESNVDGGTNVVTFSDGKKLNIKNGSKGSDGAPGADGSSGADGKDGVSPTIAVSAITGGNRLTITDANGTQSVDVMNGSDGADGANGADGAPGETGPAGRGVSSMTYNSSTNKWTIAYTDGTSSSVDGPAIPDVSGYMPKSGGTFTGAVVAGTAATSGYYVRNIKFSDTAETPTTEGDICFKLQ